MSALVITGWRPGGSYSGIPGAKLLRSVTGLNLGEAKRLIDGVIHQGRPRTVELTEGHERRMVRAQFESLGFVVELPLEARYPRILLHCAEPGCEACIYVPFGAFTDARALAAYLDEGRGRRGSAFGPSPWRGGAQHMVADQKTPAGGVAWKRGAPSAESVGHVVLRCAEHPGAYG